MLVGGPFTIYIIICNMPNIICKFIIIKFYADSTGWRLLFDCNNYILLLWRSFQRIAVRFCIEQVASGGTVIVSNVIITY